MKQYLSHLPSTHDQEVVSYFLEYFENTILPLFATLPHSVIHNDLNDNNILVQEVNGESKISGVVDFGDCIWTARVCELAIAMAYVIMDSSSPLLEAFWVIEGYHSFSTLTDLEIKCLFPLACTRMCMSVVYGCVSRSVDPSNEYAATTITPGLRVLEKLWKERREGGSYCFRKVEGEIREVIKGRQ
jgi:Ser/Thr protein kinase RdoA (MazF antagonist)